MAVASGEEQQFCLRWNNFQANITSQLGTLRDDEDFVDVTLACEGQRLEAHKMVLSACSPFFKQLFKNNPCPHPIVFMRDVEAKHIIALLEFMYAGQVNVAQANLAGFLRTAESLQIRGLTDIPKMSKRTEKKEGDPETENIQRVSTPRTSNSPHRQQSRPVTPFLDDTNSREKRSSSPQASPNKRICKTEQITSTDDQQYDLSEEAPSSISSNINTSGYLHQQNDLEFTKTMIEPKLEPDEYISDEEEEDEQHKDNQNFQETLLANVANAHGNNSGAMDLLSHTGMIDLSQDSNSALSSSDSRKLHSLDPRPCTLCGRVYSNLSNLRQHMRLIHHPQSVICPHCSKQFKTTLYLKRHLVIYHNINSNGDQQQQQPEPPTPSPESGELMPAAAAVVVGTNFTPYNSNIFTCQKENISLQPL